MLQPYTAAITLVVPAFFFYTIAAVGKARGQYGIKAPAVTGNENFERVFRVQMNTLEQMALLLPALWLCAVCASDGVAALAGVVWVVGRIVYERAYVQDPSTRSLGAMVTIAATAAAFLGAAVGIIRAPV
jgi:glutathione S-transferase